MPGRWTQYDEPEYRTGGMRRVGYDADSQRYYFQDGEDLYEGEPRAEMGGQMRYIGKIAPPSPSAPPPPPRRAVRESKHRSPSPVPTVSSGGSYEKEIQAIPPGDLQTIPPGDQAIPAAAPGSPGPPGSPGSPGVTSGPSNGPSSGSSLSRFQKIGKSIVATCKVVGSFAVRRQQSK